MPQYTGFKALPFIDGSPRSKIGEHYVFCAVLPNDRYGYKTVYAYYYPTSTSSDIQPTILGQKTANLFKINQVEDSNEPIFLTLRHWTDNSQICLEIPRTHIQISKNYKSYINIGHTALTHNSFQLDDLHNFTNFFLTVTQTKAEDDCEKWY